MQENQNTEFKESWRDEYLKWICGFANADGGSLIIGRSDKGKYVGLKDSRTLLELIPNKVLDILGILVRCRPGGRLKTYLKNILHSHLTQMLLVFSFVQA